MANASPKVLAPPPATSLGDLEDVVSIMNRLFNVVAQETTSILVESAVLRLRNYDTKEIVGHITVSSDWEDFTFTPGDVQ